MVTFTLRSLPLILLFAFCFTQNCTAIPLPELEGTWYVNKSNFKMWLKKHNHNPTFTYTSASRKGIEGLHDEVTYTKRKKIKRIVGFDKPLNTEGTEFLWKGKGILGIAKSKWEILYANEDYMVIHFKKTLFTRAGYDVISRRKQLSDEVMRGADAKLVELGVEKLLQIIPQR